MIIRFKQIIVLTTLVCSVCASYAKPSVPCPTVERIRGAQYTLKNTHLHVMSNTYKVKTDRYFHTGDPLNTIWSWQVSVENVKASSKQDAIELAKRVLQNLKYGDAIAKKGHVHTRITCSYGPGSVTAVGVRES